MINELMDQILLAIQQMIPVSKQSGSKPNTFGKLLNGYSYSVSEHGLVLRGRGLPEKIDIVRKIDQDGFRSKFLSMLS